MVEEMAPIWSCRPASPGVPSCGQPCYWLSGRHASKVLPTQSESSLHTEACSPAAPWNPEITWIKARVSLLKDGSSRGAGCAPSRDCHCGPPSLSVTRPKCCPPRPANRRWALTIQSLAENSRAGQHRHHLPLDPQSCELHKIAVVLGLYVLSSFVR